MHRPEPTDSILNFYSFRGTSREAQSNKCVSIKEQEHGEFIFPERTTFETWAGVTSVATDFVTKKLMGATDLEKQMHMVQVVTDKVIPVITEFCRDHGINHKHAHFTFKGGNVAGTRNFVWPTRFL